MKFQITNKWYIRGLDERNWIIAQMVTPKDKTPTCRAQEPTGRGVKAYERVFGYYPSLDWAKSDIVELVARESSNLEELEKAIELIRLVKE